jgi:peptidoglycan L-alanyl-D-glutamate endopeptidase CwlK
MFILGAASLKHLSTVRADIQMVVKEAIKISDIDFSCIKGFRNELEQNQVFKDGKSKARWLGSAHNFGLAVDIYPYPVDWSERGQKAFHYLGGLITATGALSGVPIVWGGTWKSFLDLPHFQHRDWKAMKDGNF